MITQIKSDYTDICVINFNRRNHKKIICYVTY